MTPTLLQGKSRLPRAHMGRPRWNPGLRQLIPDIKPEVQVDVDLGNVPLAIGFFAGSGVSFIGASQLPKPVSTVLTIAGLGLAAVGAVTLFSAAPAKPPVEGEPGEGDFEGGPGFEIPPVDVFNEIFGEIISPIETETVERGILSEDFQVLALVSNPASEDATFTLQLRITETPFWWPLGNEGDPITWLEPQVVSIPGNTTRQFTWSSEQRSTGIGIYSNMDVTLEKVRGPGESPVRLYDRFFVLR